jgi:hypothetical protein
MLPQCNVRGSQRSSHLEESLKIMLDQLPETDEAVYLKKSGIDRGVGYLIAGMVVLGFFLVIILAMGRIQTLSNDAGNAHQYGQPEEKSSEIGDTRPR